MADRNRRIRDELIVSDSQTEIDERARKFLESQTQPAGDADEESNAEETKEYPEGYQSVDTMLAAEEVKRQAEENEPRQEFSPEFAAEHRLIVEQPPDSAVEHAVPDDLLLAGLQEENENDEAETPAAEDSTSDETGDAGGENFALQEQPALESDVELETTTNIDTSEMLNIDQQRLTRISEATGIAESELSELLGNPGIVTSQTEMVSESGAVKVDLLEDGGSITQYPDGRVVVEYGKVSPEGAIGFTGHPDGVIETRYKNGDVVWEYPDGSIAMYHDVDGTTDFLPPPSKETDKQDDADSGSSDPNQPENTSETNAQDSSQDDGSKDDQDDSDDEDDDDGEDDQDQQEAESSEQEDGEDDKESEAGQSGEQGTPDPTSDGGADGPPIELVTGGELGGDQSSTIERGIEMGVDGGHTDPVNEEAEATLEFITSELGKEQVKTIDTAVEQAQSGGHTDPVEEEGDAPFIPSERDLKQIEFIASGGGTVDPVDDDSPTPAGPPLGGGVGGPAPARADEDDPEDPEDESDLGAASLFDAHQAIDTVASVQSNLLQEFAAQEIEVDLDEADLEDEM